MERDFLGLSDKQYMSNVKREVDDDGVGEHQGWNKKVARHLGMPEAFTASDFQWGSVSTASIFRRGQFNGAVQNAQPLLLRRSTPLATHSSLVPRMTTLSRSSPQLTIFYNGTVRVFDDIPPEKAQAIMLCAGNSLKVETGEINLKKQLVREVEIMGQKQINDAASSSSATFSESFSRCKDKHVDVANAMSMIESFNLGPASMIPSVPQARKASLARFLEKRKERLISAMPYKKMLLHFSTGESSGMNYSSTSPA